MKAPLFEATRVRIDVQGAPALDGLSLATTGDRVLVLGAARALFEAASGVRVPVRGGVCVLGVPAAIALRGGGIACAPRDPPVPPKWSAREYVVRAARLYGNSRALSALRASHALDQLQLGHVADGPLGRASLFTRRATSIAAAMVANAPAVLLEDPLSGLADDEARTLARLVAHALAHCQWVLFAPRLPLVSPLALAADEAMVILGSRVAGQGAPAELAAHAGAYALRVAGGASEFARRLVERGGEIAGSDSLFTVVLGALTTRDLVAIAQESNAVILELRPVAGAFG